jgi:hypothetical protein
MCTLAVLTLALYFVNRTAMRQTSFGDTELQVNLRGSRPEFQEFTHGSMVPENLQPDFVSAEQQLYDIGSWVPERSLKLCTSTMTQANCFWKLERVRSRRRVPGSTPPVAFMTHELQLSRAFNKHKETAPTPRVRGYG